ncbi:hypothetical protein [Nitrospira sp. Nam80]
MAKHSAPFDSTSAAPTAGTGDEPDIYRYEPSGIRERSGHIPTWLKLVIFALIVWGLYYGIRYWSSY